MPPTRRERRRAVDRVGWQHQYKRLLTAYGKKASQEQSAEFFAALQGCTSAAVHDGVSACIREGKYFPTVAELLAAARNAGHQHKAPLATCDVCQNSTWITLHCAGVSAPDGATKPAPVDRSHYCGRDWVHSDHDWAVRCHQCWTLGRQGDAA